MIICSGKQKNNPKNLTAAKIVCRCGTLFEAFILCILCVCLGMMANYVRVYYLWEHIFMKRYDMRCIFVCVCRSLSLYILCDVVDVRICRKRDSNESDWHTQMKPISKCLCVCCVHRRASVKFRRDAGAWPPGFLTRIPVMSDSATGNEQCVDCVCVERCITWPVPVCVFWLLPKALM